MEPTKLHLDFQANEQQQEEQSSQQTQVTQAQGEDVNNSIPNNIINIESHINKKEKIILDTNSDTNGIIAKTDGTVSADIKANINKDQMLEDDALSISLPFVEPNKALREDQTDKHENNVEDFKQLQPQILEGNVNKKNIKNTQAQEAKIQQLDEFDKTFIDNHDNEAFSDILPFAPSKISRFNLKQIFYVIVIVLCIGVGVWLLVDNSDTKLTSDNRNIAYKFLSQKIQTQQSSIPSTLIGNESIQKNLSVNSMPLNKRVTPTTQTDKQSTFAHKSVVPSTPQFEKPFGISAPHQQKPLSVASPQVQTNVNQNNLTSTGPGPAMILDNSYQPSITQSAQITQVGFIDSYDNEVQEHNPYWNLPNDLLALTIHENEFKVISEQEYLKLQEGINHKYNYQRYLTVETIRKEKIKGAESILVQALSSNKFWIKMNALITLVEFGHKMDLYHVNKVLVDERSDLIANYFKRFEKSTNQNPAILYVIRHAIKLVDAKARYNILKAISNSNDVFREIYLKAALKDPVYEIRVFAQTALKKVNVNIN